MTSCELGQRLSYLPKTNLCVEARAVDFYSCRLTEKQVEAAPFMVREAQVHQ